MNNFGQDVAYLDQPAFTSSGAEDATRIEDACGNTGRVEARR